MRLITSCFLIFAALLSITATPRTSPKFDHYYTRIGIKQENERLKNYAIQLKNSPTSRALIVVYAADEKSEKSAKARALRAYSVVVKTHGVEPGRVIWRYDGPCKNEQIVLYLLYPEQSTPSRDPYECASSVPHR